MRALACLCWAVASHSWSSKVEVDIHLESRRIDELVAEERNFASGAAQCLRCSSLANLKPLLHSTSNTVFAKDSVPSAGAKNSGKSTNDCSGPSC